MPAKDYQLIVSALMGTPYIAKKSKRDKSTMLDDRRQVPQSEFIQAIIYWAQGRLKEKAHTLELKSGEKVVANIILNDRLGKTYYALTTSEAVARVAQERNEQIVKHKFTEDHDKSNSAHELIAAALYTIHPTEFTTYFPTWWSEEWRTKLGSKPLKERLIIAASLLCAEYDRLDAEEKISAALGETKTEESM